MPYEVKENLSDTKKTNGSINTDLLFLYATEVDYWKKVLRRIVAVAEHWHLRYYRFVVTKTPLRPSTIETIYDVCRFQANLTLF